MGKDPQNSVYVSMMIDSLKRKKAVLDVLYNQTKEQEKLLLEPELDIDRFNQMIEEKGLRIDELNELDEGFDALFKKVEREIRANREYYQTEIQTMQGQIGEVSDLSMKIQALEHQNSDRLQSYLAKERKKIREFHVNNRTSTSYYQNMANVHKSDQSYFINETK